MMHQKHSSRVHWMLYLGICFSQMPIVCASPVTTSITAPSTTMGNETGYPSLKLTSSSSENKTLYVSTWASNTATDFVVAYTAIDLRTTLVNETIYSPSIIATSSKGSSGSSPSAPGTTQLTAAEYNISAAHETTTHFDTQMSSSIGKSQALTSSTETISTTGITSTPVITSTSETTSTPEITSTSETTSAPEITSTSETTSTPEITSTSETTSTPEITSTSETTSTPKITSTSETTSTPEITSTSETTSTPEITSTSETTSTPEITSTSETTSAPEITSTSETTSTPEITSTSETTSTPEITSTSETTSTPKITSTSETTSTPEITSTSETTSTPEITSTSETTSTTQCTSSTTTKTPKKDCVIDDADLLAQLRKELINDEGYKGEIYNDTTGHFTFGIGHKITPNDPEYGKPLGTKVSKKRIEKAFNADVKKAIDSCCKLFDDFQNLPNEVQLIILNMAFNLGPSGLGGFKKFRKAVNNGDWDKAADEMVDSDWYRKDVPKRAKRLEERMKKVAKMC